MNQNPNTFGYENGPAPEAVETRLVEVGMESVFTPRNETDARGALTRGLAEYVSQLSTTWGGGRELAFYNVFDYWAEPEDGAQYPSAAVYTDADGTYDASHFTPSVGAMVAPGQYLVSTSDLSVDLMLDVYTTDPIMRAGVNKMLEDALNPHDWRYGLVLDLPHYFGSRGVYELLKQSFIDSEDLSQARYRRVVFTLRATVTVYRLKTLPLHDPRVRVTTV